MSFSQFEADAAAAVAEQRIPGAAVAAIFKTSEGELLSTTTT